MPKSYIHICMFLHLRVINSYVPSTVLKGHKLQKKKPQTKTNKQKGGVCGGKPQTKANKKPSQHRNWKVFC